MLLFVLPALAAPELALVGNSYTQANRLDGVLAELLSSGGYTPVVTALAIPGYTFAGHVTEAETEGSRHHGVLIGHSPSWSWLVLQEQSQIPGFPASNSERMESATAARTLDGYARAAEAQTLFLMTWGRRDGDSANPDLYPDFLTMQSLLAEGYLSFVADTSTDERPTFVAPAGYAFRAVYEADLAAGRDPRAAGSDFAALYQEDGSHPSPEGTYLVACVLYAVLTGESPVGLSYDAGLDDAPRLAEVAAEVVFGDSPDILYPWEIGEDPGDSEDSPADSSDSPADSPAPIDESPADSRCGCASAPPRGALLPAALTLLFLRRKARISAQGST